jgi:hypothetical protein
LQYRQAQAPRLRSRGASLVGQTGAGDGHPLLLAAAELVRESVVPVGEADQKDGSRRKQGSAKSSLKQRPWGSRPSEKPGAKPVRGRPLFMSKLDTILRQEFQLPVQRTA